MLFRGLNVKLISNAISAILYAHVQRHSTSTPPARPPPTSINQPTPTNQLRPPAKLNTISAILCATYRHSPPPTHTRTRPRSHRGHSLGGRLVRSNPTPKSQGVKGGGGGLTHQHLLWTIASGQHLLPFCCLPQKQITFSLLRFFSRFSVLWKYFMSLQKKDEDNKDNKKK